MLSKKKFMKEMESGKNLLKDTIERAKYYKESYQPDIVIIRH